MWSIICQISKEIKGWYRSYSAEKMKFSIKDFSSKCDQIRRTLEIWSHLLDKSLMENLIFCTVLYLSCLQKCALWYHKLPKILSLWHVLKRDEKIEIQLSMLFMWNMLLLHSSIAVLPLQSLIYFKFILPAYIHIKLCLWELWLQNLFRNLFWILEFMDSWRYFALY